MTYIHTDVLIFMRVIFHIKLQRIIIIPFERGVSVVPPVSPGHLRNLNIIRLALLPQHRGGRGCMLAQVKGWVHSVWRVQCYPTYMGHFPNWSPDTRQISAHSTQSFVRYLSRVFTSARDGCNLHMRMLGSPVDSPWPSSYVCQVWR